MKNLDCIIYLACINRLSVRTIREHENLVKDPEERKAIRTLKRIYNHDSISFYVLIDECEKLLGFAEKTIER